MPLQLSYRPQSFDEVIGNESTVRALAAKMQSEDCPHAFLITGPSGCGKTTLARLIALSLGVIESTHDTNVALGNYREMDSADFRGIDTIRDIRRTMRKSALGGGYRVYLLDECHQLTKDAQEALLKALEDTPPHVYFILATTDPEKLKVTLKRRCSHFEVGLVDKDVLAYYLWQVIEWEEKAVPEEIVNAIVEDALGSPGVAMMLLDKVIDMDPADMEEQVHIESAKQNQAIELCRALMAKTTWKKVTPILEGLRQEDPEGIRRLMIAYCVNILLKGKNDKAYLVLDCFREPFFTMPYQQLVMACYDVIEGT